jgi:hypothetical protein
VFQVDVLVAFYLSIFVFKYCQSRVPYFPLSPAQDHASVVSGAHLLLPPEHSQYISAASSSPDGESPRVEREHQLELAQAEGEELHVISLSDDCRAGRATPPA